MTTPRSVRFESDTLEKLAAFAARNPGLTGSGAAAMFVDEGLRMESHPGVFFRTGPSGRRAVLAGGPDVWEVVKSVRDTRLAAPSLSRRDLVALVALNTGLNERSIGVALDYYADNAAEIDAEVRLADSTESLVEAGLAKLNQLLDP